MLLLVPLAQTPAASALTPVARALTRSQIAGALAAFRILYYLLPLSLAAVMLGTRELMQLRRRERE